MNVTSIEQLYIPSTIDTVEMIDACELENVFTNKYDIDNYIISKLKKKLTMKCNHTGYIGEDISVINRSIGKLKSTHFNGNVYYNLKLKINICVPLIGSRIACKVLGKNNAGVLCEVHPFKIILCENIDTELEHINIGDDLIIEIVNFKIVINDKNIKVLGKLISKL